MRYTLLPFVFLMTLASGGDDFGGWFPPRDLISNINAKATLFLSRRVDPPATTSALHVVCSTDHGYDRHIATPPDMVLSASISITGLPDAENHANEFEKIIQEVCLAGNLAKYTPRGDPSKTAIEVVLQIKAARKREGRAPPFCVDDAIRKFTGKPDLPSCHDSGF